MGVDVDSVKAIHVAQLLSTSQTLLTMQSRLDQGGRGKEKACYQGRCSGRLHQEEGHVDQSSPDPRGVMWTPSCWSQMLSCLPPVLLLLLALVMMVMMMKHWSCVGRISGTQPEEEVGVGQMMMLDQPVHHVMSLSCAVDKHQTTRVSQT